MIPTSTILFLPDETARGTRFSIRLKDGRYAFGRILKNPLCAFYRRVNDQVVDVDEIARDPIGFKVWVIDSAFKQPNWRVVGFRSLEPELRERAWSFKEDPISKALSLYSEGEERPASERECENVERAAVWSAGHIEDRLIHYFNGTQAKWHESMKLKRGGGG